MEVNDNQPDFQPEPASWSFDEVKMAAMRQTITAITSALGQYIGASPVRMILFKVLPEQAEISQAEIQRKLGVDGAVVTRVLKRMEADGLINRRTDPADNRFMLVKLTEAGRERQAEVALKLNKVKSTLMQGLNSEELLSMQRTLERIRQNAENLIGGSAGNIFPGEDPF